jgi:hypothetical protein
MLGRLIRISFPRLQNDLFAIWRHTDSDAEGPRLHFGSVSAQNKGKSLSISFQWDIGVDVVFALPSFMYPTHPPCSCSAVHAPTMIYTCWMLPFGCEADSSHNPLSLRIAGDVFFRKANSESLGGSEAAI